MANKQSQKTSILAIISLIFACFFSIIGLVLPSLPIDGLIVTIFLLLLLFLPIIGLVLGIIALSDIRKNPSLKGKGLAISGIVIIIIFILILISYYGVFNTTPKIKKPYCTLPMGLYCNDFSVVPGNPGYTILKLENGMGEGMIIEEMNITSYTNETNCYIDLTKELPGGPKTYNNLDGWHLSNEEEETVKIFCDIIPSEENKVKYNLYVSFCWDNAANNEECKKSSHNLWGEAID